MASVAMDGPAILRGHYSVSSSTFPSIRYVGRLGMATLGLLQGETRCRLAPTAVTSGSRWVTTATWLPTHRRPQPLHTEYPTPTAAGWNPHRRSSSLPALGRRTEPWHHYSCADQHANHRVPTAYLAESSTRCHHANRHRYATAKRHAGGDKHSHRSGDRQPTAPTPSLWMS